MKKDRILFLLLGVIALFMIIAGVWQRSSYTNVEASGEIWSRLEVFPAADSFLEQMLSDMETVETMSAAIVKVTAVEDIDFMAKQTRQKVKVNRVFCNQLGEGICEGNEIFVACSSNMVFFQELDPVTGERPDYLLCNTGFVNFMKAGEEYLVFLESHIENIADEDTEAYFTTNTMMMPVYAYKDAEEFAVSERINEETRSVPYSEVKNNEFFVQSEDAYQKLQDAKHTLLKKYE